MSIVGIIGDIHAPFTLESYPDFVWDTFKGYKCNKIKLIGDIMDVHTITNHLKSPKAEGALQEYDKARKVIAKLVKMFPKADVCIGNHDERPYRMASTIGMPDIYLKSMGELYGTPKTWRWSEKFEEDGVYYLHGTGSGDNSPHLRIAKQMRNSVVCGHFHSVGGVEFSVTEKDILFGMCVGCGIDRKAYAFDYSKMMINKPVIGCGVVIDGRLPIFVPMKMAVNPLKDIYLRR